MATTPFLMMLTKFLRNPDKGTARKGPAADGASALVIGYGRFGQTVAQMLILAGIRVSMIDTKVSQIDIAEEFGSTVHYGDGTRMDLLRQAGAQDAALILFCIDGDQLSPDFLAMMREAFPQADILVRAFDRRTLIKLADAPITRSVREMMESAIVMGRGALESAGLSLGEIERVEETYRDNDAMRLADQIAAGDIYGGRERAIVQGGPHERDENGRDKPGSAPAT